MHDTNSFVQIEVFLFIVSFIHKKHDEVKYLYLFFYNKVRINLYYLIFIILLFIFSRKALPNPAREYQ